MLPFFLEIRYGNYRENTHNFMMIGYHFWAKFAILDGMDKYFLAIVALIIFSLLVILYVRIFEKVTPPSPQSDDLGPKDLKPDDFSILE